MILKVNLVSQAKMGSSRSVKFAANFAVARFNDGYVKTASHLFSELMLPMPAMFSEFCGRQDLLRAAQKENRAEMKDAQKLLSFANANRKMSALLERLETDDLGESEEAQCFEMYSAAENSDSEDSEPLEEKKGRDKRVAGYQSAAFYKVNSEKKSRKKKKQ